MESVHFYQAGQQKFKDVMNDFLADKMIKDGNQNDQSNVQQTYKKITEILMSNQSEQFINELKIIAQEDGVFFYYHKELNIILMLENNKIINIYQTINFNRCYCNQYSLYLYYHNDQNDVLQEKSEVQVVQRNESQVLTNLVIGKNMGFCTDYYFIIQSKSIKIYQCESPNVIFQEIPHQCQAFDEVQIKINVFNNEVMLNFINFKTSSSLLMTISIFNQIDPTIPSFCNPEMAKKQGYFKENGFIITGNGNHRCLLYMLNYIQNGRYMAMLRAKNTKEKFILQKIEEKHTETTEDRLWKPVNYYQEDQFKHFCQLYDCQVDSQYLENKLRLINQDFVWLVEPYVLSNPHEVIYIKERIDLVNKFYIIPSQQPNENVFMIQINNTIQIYQHCGYLWSLLFEITFGSSQVSISTSPNKFCISALCNGILLSVSYKLLTIFANNHNQLVRQADQITLVTDLNKNILPHPHYNYGANSSEPLLNSQIINEKIIQLTQTSLCVKEICYKLSHFDDQDTQDYNLHGFTAYQEQENINKQNVMEEELKKKQQEQKADMEDGYDLCLDRDVEDLFRNDYYYEDPEECNYDISIIKEFFLNQDESNIIPIGLMYNQNMCYCLLYSFRTGFVLGYFSDQKMQDLKLEALNCQQIKDYQNILQSILIKCDTGIIIRGQNHDIYFKGINNSIKDVSQSNILLKDMDNKLILYNFNNKNYIHLKYFRQQVKENTRSQNEMHNVQFNQTYTQLYTLDVLNQNQITDYLNTDQNKYVIVLTNNNYLIAFNKENGLQQYACKVHINSKLVSAYLNNQITLYMRWGLLETRTPSTLQENSLIKYYINKQYNQVKHILNESRIPFTYIPYHLHFVNIITQQQQQLDNFAIKEYFKFLLVILEQKHYDLTSTAQFLLHNNLSDRQADTIPDYACFNLIYEYYFMIQLLLYLINVNISQIAEINQFLEGLTAAFPISDILQNDIYKINHNIKMQQYIYDNLTVKCMEVIDNHINSNSIAISDEKSAELLLQVLFWFTSHHVALFFNAQNKFALEQELKRVYLLFYPQYKRLGYINLYVRYANMYSDISQIFKLMPQQLTQEAGEDLMIGLEEVNQQIQALENIKKSSQLTQLYSQLINIMSFQADNKVYKWVPNMEYADMLLQDGIDILAQILIQQLDHKSKIEVQVLQQLNNLLFCADNDQGILINVVNELYQQLSNKNLMQNVVEECCVKYRLKELKTLDVKSYLLEFLFGNQKSMNQAKHTKDYDLASTFEQIILAAKNQTGTQDVQLLKEYVAISVKQVNEDEIKTVLTLVQKVINKQNIQQVIELVQTWFNKINIQQVVLQLKENIQRLVNNKQQYYEKKSQVLKDFCAESDQQWKKMDQKQKQFEEELELVEEKVVPIVIRIESCFMQTNLALSFFQTK